ncbi:hypothetical protein [Alteromonas naphthalenivorans]|uniref:Uncharacterized protein n=1 Tax=Alteromonas naphthalenivorans TaxID=715451 RepID=F5ZG32_ALTNA|nr:hypothetical protein [Alteromonas naphthalenivorans]AEF05800.1 hypothetical protein ambt_21545 [Alteromonas naphthalenivorans]
MSVIPCKQNKELKDKIEEYADTLKTEAHKLGSHGLSESEFYNSGLFRGAIERVRGQFSATMREKRELVQHILNHLQDNDFIDEWESVGSKNRHDYTVKLKSGRHAVIELKGCLDGNNTNIFDRPNIADEFIIWSVCTNPGANPRRNAWSGIHTRLSAEVIERQQQVDGLVIWDMSCGTLGRDCPKMKSGKVTEIGPFKLPPPCIYLFPSTIPSARNNPEPRVHQIDDIEILQAFHNCFYGKNEELNRVTFKVKNQANDTVRLTSVERNGVVVQESSYTAIKRS